MEQASETKKSSIRDLTTGSVGKLIIGFALPMLLGMIFQQLYSMTDAIIVGNLLGVDAFSAVGSTNSINFMIIGFCIGSCSGLAIPIANRFGSHRLNSMRKFVANSIWVGTGIAVILTTVVCIFCMQILRLMNTPQEIIHTAYSYIFVIFLGIPTNILYNLCAGIIRALGDSRTPLYFLIISAVINIILDIVFIMFLHFGVDGAAWATLISQGISGVLSLMYISKHFHILHLSRQDLVPNRMYISHLLYIGIPMGLQYSITAIGTIIISYAVNSLGKIYIAAVTAGSKVSILFCCPFDALGSTMATFAGQNVGAKKLDRVRAGIRFSVIIASIYSIVAFIVLYFFGTQIAQLFLSSESPVAASQTADILKNASLYLIFNSAFYIPLALVNIYRFCIQGMGFSSFAMFAGVSEMIARALAGVFLTKNLGFIAICLASPLAWIMADIFLLPAFHWCLKRLGRRYSISH